MSSFDGLTLEEAAIALACRNPDTTLATIAKRAVGKLWEDAKKKPYTDLFHDKVTASDIWTSVCFMRAVDSLITDAAIETNASELFPFAIHGNRYLLHIMFQLFSAEISTFDANSEKNRLRIKETLKETLIKTAAERKRLHPDGYLQSLFKNQGKTKDLAQSVLTIVKAAS